MKSVIHNEFVKSKIKEKRIRYFYKKTLIALTSVQLAIIGQKTMVARFKILYLWVVNVIKVILSLSKSLVCLYKHSKFKIGYKLKIYSNEDINNKKIDNLYSLI